MLVKSYQQQYSSNSRNIATSCNLIDGTQLISRLPPNHGLLVLCKTEICLQDTVHLGKCTPVSVGHQFHFQPFQLTEEGRATFSIRSNSAKLDTHYRGSHQVLQKFNALHYRGPDAVRRGARRRHDPFLEETRKLETFILISDKNK